MFIIFGTSKVGKVLGSGQFHCPDCQTERPYLLKQNKQFFSVFFIPLIPLKDYGRSLKCNVCKSSFVPGTVLSHEEYQPYQTGQAGSFSPGIRVSANFGKRILSFIIDFVIITVLVGILYAVVGMSNEQTAETLKGAIQLVFFGIAIVYFCFFEYILGGASLGKKIASIAIVPVQSDQKLSFGKALFRGLFKSACTIFPLLFLVGAVTKNNRAIHDFIAGTMVVDK